MPAYLSTLTTSYPANGVRVLAEELSGATDALESGAADLLLCYSHPDIPALQPDTAFERRTICRDRLVPVTGIDEDWAALNWDRSATPYLKYSRSSFLGRVTSLILGQATHPPNLNLRYENSMADSLKSAAVASMGVAWLPMALAEPELKRGKLRRIPDRCLESVLFVVAHRRSGDTRKSLTRLWSQLG